MADHSEGTIPQRPLGRTGTTVSALGLGDRPELYKSTMK